MKSRGAGKKMATSNILHIGETMAAYDSTPEKKRRKTGKSAGSRNHPQRRGEAT